jgi:hypothetical protein
MERNLNPARDLGMHTILIGIGNGNESTGDSHTIANIKELNDVLRKMVQD